MPSQPLRPLRSRQEQPRLRQRIRLPLWIGASLVAGACSRPDGDILYRPFGPADHLTDGTSGRPGELIDAGYDPDPPGDASQGGTGGADGVAGAGGSEPGEPAPDSGTDSDAAAPQDAASPVEAEAGTPS